MDKKVSIYIVEDYLLARITCRKALEQFNDLEIKNKCVLSGRNGSVYLMANGEYGRGPFTMAARQEILRRLLQLELDTGFELITLPELKMIDKMWEDEGDLSRRALVDIYYEVKGERLPWDQYKHAKYSEEDISLIEELCAKHDIPFELMSKLMITVDNSKVYTRSSTTAKNVERVLNEGWLHFESIREGLENENQND